MRMVWVRRPSVLALYAALLGSGTVFLMPLSVVVVTAFKPLDEIVGGDMLAPPAH